ncbi:MAG: aminoacetone oxidase family FAD-binding enzyme [Clostridia bacterium]|nr:aminoacetone oxidase family FAD-binding enzyme [Clostridia bacterium]
MKSDNFDVIIIGGGAGGLFLAAQLPNGLSVAIIESNDRVGKKLLATGNGKCNLTNLDMDMAHYNNPDFVGKILSRFGAKDTVAAFEKLGLVTKLIDTRVYPYSECASSVLDVLRRAALRNGTHIFTGHTVNSIDRLGECFVVSGTVKNDGKTDKEFSLRTDHLVLATGSPATFGKDSTNLYTERGHKARKMTPSLMPIKTNKEPIKGLQGVRVKAGVRLGERYEIGEILFKDFGVSGIAAFNISSEIARGRAHAGDTLSIDFMPEYSRVEVKELLRKRGGGTVGEMLTGTFHSKVQERIMHAAGCTADDKATDKISAIAAAIKEYKLTVEGLGDLSLAQAMSGGLNTSEFDENLMSRREHRLYAIGEALDIDGDCGGYNLQWAWSSAAVVANSLQASIRALRERNSSLQKRGLYLE